MSDGYLALREGVAWLELSARGRIIASGEDRARLLHALTTNHIQQLQPGDGTYAFFLTAQGRILADAHVLCLEESLLLDTEPEARVRLFEHIDHYIIADDVVLEDETERMFAVGVEGPLAGPLLAGLGAEIPMAPGSHVAWGDLAVARIAVTGDGFRVYGEAERQAELVARLANAGAIPASATGARVVRIERGIPRLGEDIVSTTLPQETGMPGAVHSSKGCYIGQEIVERIRSRGHVNKMLAAIQIDGAGAFAPGTKVMAADAEVGEITSSVYSPGLAKVVGMAMLRVAQARPGVALEVEGAPARVSVAL